MLLQRALSMGKTIGLFLKAPVQPAAVQKVTARLSMNKKIPFIPIDWYFRFFPNVTKDKVRTMYRHNAISYFGAIAFWYGLCHTPFAGDGYLHLYESPLYRKVKRDLEASGQLEENLRIKVNTFYPPDPEEAGEEGGEDDE